MGTMAEAAMKFRPCYTGLSLVVLVSALLIQGTEAYSINRDPYQVERRVYWEPEDARTLFNGPDYKRSFSSGSINPSTYDAMMSAMAKRGRGLRDPYDPRHLFHSIYGGVFRR